MCCLQLRQCHRAHQGSPLALVQPAHQPMPQLPWPVLLLQELSAASALQAQPQQAHQQHQPAQQLSLPLA